MATPKQIAANRRNASKSCGPKSPAGKEKVSHNRLVHGLCGQFQVLPEIEKQEHFDALRNQLIIDEKPVGQAEIELVIKMAEHTWLAKRALRMQNLCFVPQPRTPEHHKNNDIPIGIADQLEDYVRYHAAQDRAYQRASKELRDRRKERHNAEIGFESQKRAAAAEQRQADEAVRKTEKHAFAIATANLKKQREEMKFAKELAEILPVAHSASGASCARSHFDFDFSARNAAFSAAPHANPPAFHTE